MRDVVGLAGGLYPLWPIVWGPDSFGGDNNVFSAAAGVSLGGEELDDETLQHLLHQPRGGSGEQIIQMGYRVDGMRCSSHRHVSFGEMC